MTSNNGRNGHGVTGVAGKAVTALAATPTLLVLVLLNTAMLGIAGWYLGDQAEYRHKERLEGFRIIEEHCFKRDK